MSKSVIHLGMMKKQESSGEIQVSKKDNIKYKMDRF